MNELNFYVISLNTRGLGNFTKFEKVSIMSKTSLKGYHSSLGNTQCAKG